MIGVVVVGDRRGGAEAVYQGRAGDVKMQGRGVAAKMLP